MADIRLSKKEYAGLYSRQQSDRTTMQALTREAKRKLAALDPDLPGDVRAKQAARVQAEYWDRAGALLHTMRERADLIAGQAPHYSRASILRREGLTAPVALTMIVQRATDAGLAQLAADAAADNDRVLAGAIALEIGPRNLSLENSRVVAEALATMEFPEVADLDVRLFRPVVDAFHQCSLEALEVRGGSAVEKLTHARALGRPVLGVDHAA